MSERFLIRTEGGPRPGTKVAEGIGWPLPELLLWDHGAYVKVAESTLPPRGGDYGVLRGAEYRWQEAEATADQLASAVAVEIRARRLEEAVGLMYLLALRDPAMAQAAMDMIEIAPVADRLGNEVPLRITWAKGDPVPAAPDLCEPHTGSPDGFLQWHAWAERMEKTHKQRQCTGCGLWAIWEPKEKADA